MPHTTLIDDPTLDLTTRLLQAKKITDDLESFLNPTYKQYRDSPANLNDIQIGAERLIAGIEKGERIMIFGDYDVDGICASYVLWTFVRKYLEYDQISIKLPHRIQDGYGIRSKHLDQIHELGCQLVITVDNGITATAEAKHAKTLGIDMVITDHHHAPATLPDALAIINPQCSPDVTFKEICGATVSLKYCLHIADIQQFTREQKLQILDDFLPFIGIATVADCMPLIGENRLIVKKTLDMMNTRRNELSGSLQGMLTHLGIDAVDAYHFGFVIGPRLNATGRVGNAHDGLACLLCHDQVKQRELLIAMDELNEGRKGVQDAMLETALEKVDQSKKLLIAADESFHAGIVGIVAGRLTESRRKPSAILQIQPDKGIATGSLRGPTYFSVLEMLQSADDLLERYGGHEQAGGLTVKIENLEKLEERLISYCESHISDEDLIRVTTVDTPLYESDITVDLAQRVARLGPYGISFSEPLFSLDEMVVTSTKTFGKSERTHLKIFGTLGQTAVSCMWRGHGDMGDEIAVGSTVTVIGKIKVDTYAGGWYVDVKGVERS